jgi:site-specific DNA-methyltransferase (adenine-specific)
VADALQAMRGLLGDNDVLAYIVMMGARLVELHRVLKPTGSLYLHCDPTASHYLKVLLDAVFGPQHFRNEIIWRRTGTHGKVRRFGPVHDVILFFTKTDAYKWNYPRKLYMAGHVASYFVKDAKGWRTNYYGNVMTGSGLRGGESGQPWRGFDPTAKGRHWAIPGALVDEVNEDLSSLTQHQKLERLYELGYIKIVPGQAWPIYEHYIDTDDGTAAPDLWTYQPYTEGTVFGSGDGIDADVRWLSPQDSERLGYQTQKPLGLLERIIQASSDPDDLVLDPFCGCGTTVDAAQKLHRRWVGIDITFLAIDLIENRLVGTYGEQVKKTYQVTGIPHDMEGAAALFAANPFDFERWAVSLVDAQPNQKQVGDKGIDGVARFPTDNKSGVGRALVSIKGGKQVNPAMVQELGGALQQHKAEMGIFICMTPPTKGMIEAANKSGTYEWPVTATKYPRLQILTIAELLGGKRPQMPTPFHPYLQARKLVDVNQMTLKI